MARVPIRRGWPVVRSRRQRLNPGLLIVRDGHSGGFLQRAFQQPGVYDFNVLVDMQDLDHLPFKFRVPPLHVIADLVRPDLALRQYAM